MSRVGNKGRKEGELYALVWKSGKERRKMLDVQIKGIKEGKKSQRCAG